MAAHDDCPKSLMALFEIIDGPESQTETVDDLVDAVADDSLNED